MHSPAWKACPSFIQSILLHHNCFLSRLRLSYFLLKFGVLHCHTPVLPWHKHKHSLMKPSAAQWLSFCCSWRATGAQTLPVRFSSWGLIIHPCAATQLEQRQREPGFASPSQQWPHIWICVLTTSFLMWGLPYVYTVERHQFKVLCQLLPDSVKGESKIIATVL